MGFEVGYVFPTVALPFQMGPMKTVILLPALLGLFVLMAAVSTESSRSQEADLFRNEGLFQETARVMQRLEKRSQPINSTR